MKQLDVKQDTEDAQAVVSILYGRHRQRQRARVWQLQRYSLLSPLIPPIRQSQGDLRKKRGRFLIHT
jgi:hypothetical protein